MTSWRDRWYQNIPEVIQRTLDYYSDRDKNWARVTAARARDERGWVGLDPTQFVASIAELGYMYIPSKMEPGPMFLFPEFDLDDRPMRAQTRPLYELLPNSKYVTLGVDKQEFEGPVWLGNQERNIARILNKGVVVICEGPFDLLALRLAAPEVPSMSSLTKNLGEDQVDFLRLLGVSKVYLMYDNEFSEQGEKSMKALQRQYGDHLSIETLMCPAGDPSECLQSVAKTRDLRSILNDLI